MISEIICNLLITHKIIYSKIDKDISPLDVLSALMNHSNNISESKDESFNKGV